MVIKVAGIKPTVFYWSGLIIKNPMFFPVSKEIREKLKKDLNRINQDAVIIPKTNTYTKLVQIKKNILLKGVNSLPVSYTLKAKKLQTKLKSKLSQLLPNIKKEFKLPKAVIYIIPQIGENAESLGNILALGDSFKPDIATGVILEELLHSVVNNKNKIYKQLPRKIPSHLKEEVVVGYYLYKILTKYKIVGKKDVDSLVFGWQNGRRAKFVKELIEVGLQFNKRHVL